jgi:hypothetical protein
MMAAFQRAEVAFVVIGGLARVIRGADEITYGVDICPSPLKANGPRFTAALADLSAVEVPITQAENHGPDNDTSFAFNTPFGPLTVVAAPGGVPKGYDALRPAATREHLGGGLQPLVASTADLITMAAARGRPEDLARLPELQHILKLESRLSRLVQTPSHDPRYDPPAHDRDRDLGR